MSEAPVHSSRARALILVCTLVAYASACLGPFQYDDFGVIVRDAPVHSLVTSWPALIGGMRPLLKLSYALNWAVDPGPLGFHVLNIVIHLANVWLVFGLAAAVPRGARAMQRPGVDAGALVAGALFALHPVQTEAVTYISGRSVSLMTFFVLLAMRAYAEGARTQTAWRWLGLAPLAFGCALLTKEAAATLPLALIAWEWIVVRDAPCDAWPRWVAWAALAVGALAVLVLDDATFTLLYGMLGQRPLLDAIQFQLHGVAYLLSRLVLVHRLSIEPGLGVALPSVAVRLVEAIAICASVVAALGQSRARPRVAFGVLWFVLQVFVPYVVLQRVDVVNERHMYLANAGLFLAIGAIADEVTARWDPSRLRALGLVGLIGLGAPTTARNLDYGTPITLWESTVRASPGSPRAHQNLGILYERDGRLEEARVSYMRALRIEPGYAAAFANLQRVTRRLETTPATQAR